MSNQPPPGRCLYCGAQTLAPKEQGLTRKRRSKFGVGWLLLTILTGGLGLILYLIWPRHNELVSVDRWIECTSCGGRQ
jgi:DNA-directed RNA polymerase subunit RPC12/RpoP